MPADRSSPSGDEQSQVPLTTGRQSWRQDWKGLVLVVLLLAMVPLGWGLPMLIGVLAIVGMLFLHELGHYLTARAAGMKVTEFFLGFGPRLWSFRRGETLYGLKAIPAGAYVRIIGMNNLEEVSPAEEHRTYRSKPYWRRMSVAVAGSTVHMLLALTLIYAFLVTGGRTESTPSPDWTVSRVAADTPAERAGLLPGDRIVSVNGQPVVTMDDLPTVLPGPGSPADLGIERGGDIINLTLTLAAHPNDASRGFVGIGSSNARVAQPVDVGYFEAVPETLEDFGFLIKESVVGIGRIFSPTGLFNFFQQVADRPGDPATAPSSSATPAVASSEDDDRVLSMLGVLRIIDELFEGDYQNLLLLFALVNIFIGVFNMIPLLPFDGGHVAIATYERFRSRRGRRYVADISKMVPVTYAVLFIVLFVGLGALYLDAIDPVDLPG